MRFSRPAMSFLLALSLAFSLALGAFPALGEMQEADLHPAVAAGRERFVDACAFCHGLSGKGQGMAAGMLEHSPPDLTQLRKNNGGRLPLRRLYDMIDGREALPAHGERDMPVWGAIWQRNVPEQYAEYYVRGRILELLLYLDAIQE